MAGLSDGWKDAPADLKSRREIAARSSWSSQAQVLPRLQYR
jgi:hypothetical protein